MIDGLQIKQGTGVSVARRSPCSHLHQARREVVGWMCEGILEFSRHLVKPNEQEHRDECEQRCCPWVHAGVPHLHECGGRGRQAKNAW